MARAALGWSLDDLAAAAGVDRKTILRFEQGERQPRTANLDGIRTALEGKGVRFIEAGPDAGGVVPPRAV
jgi:transcriptional regulator with XRE-family HTH domain